MKSLLQRIFDYSSKTWSSCKTDKKKKNTPPEGKKKEEEKKASYDYN